jgi:hypothetical protein
MRSGQINQVGFNLIVMIAPNLLGKKIEALDISIRAGSQ